MSTVTAAPKTALATGSGVTLPRVIRAEWTKLWSLRSTRWSLAVAFIAQAGLGPLIALIEMSRWNQLSLSDRLTLDPIDKSLGGHYFAQLAIGVLGVLIISGEYGTGQIRSTLLAVPKRLPVLWAKLIVFAAVSFVLVVVAAFISFFAANAIFTEHHMNVAISAPHALRAVIGSALYVTATGVLCMGLGTIIRATAGGISAFVVILFVLPPVIQLLPSSLADSISPWLPFNAGRTVATVVNDPHSLSSWGGFAVYCGYALIAVAAGAYLLKTRDA